jgi:glycosyltransferase involved in cell wall biosynthesis
MNNSPGQKVIISVVSDLVTDQRVNRAAMALHNYGYEVTLVGRRMRNSLPAGKRPYKLRRFSLFFETGPFFYATYNITLFFYLLFKKADVYLANDLDTLLPNYLVSKLKKVKLVYDTHEYFTEVPELVSRPSIQRIWVAIERKIFPHLNHIMTVNSSIAAIYSAKYDKHVHVVRNVPAKLTGLLPEVSRGDWKIPADAYAFLFQGAGINIHRGAEEAISAIRLVPNAVLIFIGAGDVLEKIKTIVLSDNLGQKVFFIPKQPFNKLRAYSSLADFGLTLDRDTNLNYRFSLPNKLFDYIHSGLPVLATRLPEVEKIVTTYDIGLLTDSLEPKALAAKMQEMIADKEQLDKWKKNLLLAAADLCWEKEEEKFLEVFTDAGT